MRNVIRKPEKISGLIIRQKTEIMIEIAHARHADTLGLRQKLLDQAVFTTT